MRYFIQLSYKGTNYHGWQYQPNATSVQETLNKALTVFFRQQIDVVGAGRTDTGVHAKQMFAHFDLEENINASFYIHKLNSYLPKDIAIQGIYKVHDDAHARFDAKKRTYEYHINTQKNAFQSDDSWYYSNFLNIEKMNKACEILYHFTDFQCFSKVHTDVNTFDCKIYEAFWTRDRSELVTDKQENTNLIFTISADRFLRNMVRAIVGTMVNVGLEKITLEDFQAIIKSKDRNKAGFSVPAHGLYLTKIEYDYL